MDAPKDNGTICVGSLYITNSGSGQTQATGSWTGVKEFIYWLRSRGLSDI